MIAHFFRAVANTLQLLFACVRTPSAEVFHSVADLYRLIVLSTKYLM